MIKRGASWGKVNKYLRTLSPSIRKKVIPKVKDMKSKAGTDLARGLRRTKKDLLSKEGIDRYRREYISNVKRHHKGGGYKPGTWDKLPVGEIQRRKIAYANSPKFVKDYKAMVNRQLDNTTSEVVPGLVDGGRRAQYFMKHRPGNTLKRIQPKDVIRGDKQYGGVTSPTVKGHVQIAGPNPNITSSPVSSAAHEFKHAVQPGLKAYYPRARKHVPPGSTVRADWDSYYRDISSPHEISARLTEARTANIGENLRIANQQKIPEWYQNLLDVFGTPQNINNALKNNWAMAPMAGLLSQLEVGE